MLGLFGEEASHDGAHKGRRETDTFKVTFRPWTGTSVATHMPRLGHIGTMATARLQILTNSTSKTGVVTLLPSVMGTGKQLQQAAERRRRRTKRKIPMNPMKAMR